VLSIVLYNEAFSPVRRRPDHILSGVKACRII